MKLPIRITLKSPQITTSFTIVDAVLNPPSPNDQLIFTLDHLRPLPCRVSHISHFCNGDDLPVCLIVLDRVLLETSAQYMALMESFAKNYEPKDIEHIEEEDDTLWQRMVGLLIELDSNNPIYKCDTQQQWQHFSKVLAETFRSLLIAEMVEDVSKIDLDQTNRIVVALHNAILDNKDKHSGQVNLREMLIEFDSVVNPENHYTWSAPLEKIIDASNIIFKKVKLNYTLSKSTVRDNSLSLEQSRSQ